MNNRKVHDSFTNVDYYWGRLYLKDCFESVTQKTLHLEATVNITLSIILLPFFYPLNLLQFDQRDT